MSAPSYRGIEYGTYELEQRPRKSVELAVEAGGAQPLSPVTPCCSIWEWDSVYSILLSKLRNHYTLSGSMNLQTFQRANQCDTFPIVILL